MAGIKSIGEKLNRLFKETADALIGSFAPAARPVRIEARKPTPQEIAAHLRRRAAAPERW
jgi:hypothetical protein